MFFNFVKMNWTKLRTEEEYKPALKRLDEIFHAEPDTPLGDEAELLLLLIQKYEEEHHAIPDADPIEVILMQMNYKGFTAT